MKEKILKILNKKYNSFFDIDLLDGDASIRKYYRLKDKYRSFIVSSDVPFSGDNSFLKTQRTFNKLGVGVPEIFDYVDYEGLVIQEDIGDLSLEKLKDRDINIYKKIIDIILIYQKSKCEDFPFSETFTKEKFLSELNMSSDCFLKEDFSSFYDDLTNKMIKMPFLLQHRDCHSRNIFLKNDKIIMIDFQDARLGPYPYDLASLIIDPYGDVTLEEEKELLSYYYEKIKDFININSFYDDYTICYIQRGLKILGTYKYQYLKYGKDIYLKYIPITKEKLKNKISYFKNYQKYLEVFLESIDS